jgi:hypothetical protein
MFENNDSSDDNDESLSKQVLPTTDDNNGPIDINKMPTTGEEYLRQVRYDDSFALSNELHDNILISLTVNRKLDTVFSKRIPTAFSLIMKLTVKCFA